MNFTQFLLILNARKAVMLITLAVTVVATLAVSLVLPKTYTATTSLVIDFKGADPISGLPMAMMGQMLPAYIATEVDVIGSHNVALKVVDALKLTDNALVREQFMEDTEGKGSIRDWLADRLLKYLKVEPSRESSVVEVSYKGSNPQFAAAIANAFAQAYMTTNLELKVEPAKQSSAWFDDQIKSLRGNLDRAQAKLSAYQRQKGIVSVDERLDVETARLNDIAGQLVLVQSQASDAQSRQKQLIEATSKGRTSEALPEIVGNNLIQGLKADLARAEGKLADVSERVGKNHPEYQRAHAEVESLKKKIDFEIKNASRTISHNAEISQSRVNDMKNALAAQKSKILELTHKRDDFAVLTREVENAQKMLDGAMQRSGQTRLESQINHTNIAVLNPAVPPIEASSPRVLLNTVLSIILGSVLGIGVAFLMEMMDRRIRSGDELFEILGVPVLGVLESRVGHKQSGMIKKFLLRPASA